MGALDNFKRITEKTSNLARQASHIDNIPQIYDNFKGKTFDTASSLITKANDMKPQIIDQAANINYNAIAVSLQTIRPVYSVPNSVILSMKILQNAADDYNASTAKDKDERFLNCIVNQIDAEFLLASIKPMAKFIPGGGVIIKMLQLVVLITKQKNR